MCLGTCCICTYPENRQEPFGQVAFLIAGRPPWYAWDGEVSWDTVHFLLKWGKSQAHQDELVTPHLARPSQDFQTKGVGEHHDTKAGSSERGPPD